MNQVYSNFPILQLKEVIIPIFRGHFIWVFDWGKEGKLENENATPMTQITLKICVSAKFTQPATKWSWFFMDKNCQSKLLE